MNTERPEPRKKNMWVALWPLLFLVLIFQFGHGQSGITKSMGITQHLGASVPKDLPFKDENGKSIRFGDMLHGRPVVLVPIFYSCKTGCAILTDNIVKTLAAGTKGDILRTGRDMDILMYSIDPVEDAELAHAKKAQILDALSPHLPTPAATEAWRMGAEDGWHLLTGPNASIQALSSAIGLKYMYRTVPDLEHKTSLNLINHPTCTVILTSEGKISSYTIGNDFTAKEVVADLQTAQRGAVGIKADQSWMFGCLMVDPVTGRNRLMIENIWRLTAVVTLVVLATWIIGMFVKGKGENTVGGGGLSLR